MAEYDNFYGGAKYPLDPKSGQDFLGFDYRYPAGVFALPTDPRSANQIKAVSDKLNTGAKVVEITAITPETLDYIPDQHLEEINRLRKLTKVDLTFHGPLVEPTGVTRQGWDETHREQAERQMWSAVQRANKVDPKGNVIVTFHSSNGLPEPETRVIDTKTGKPVVTELFAVDEREGRFNQIKPKPNYLLGGEEAVADAAAELKELNKGTWTKTLSSASFHAQQGKSSIVNALGGLKALQDEEGIDISDRSFMDLYKMSSTPEGFKLIEKYFPQDKRAVVQKRLGDLNYGDISIRDAYNDLQNQFNLAWKDVNKFGSAEDKTKLQNFQKEMEKKIKEEKLAEDPKKLPELADAVSRGIAVLSSLSEPPQTFRPLKDFAIDKASETFSNVALNAYHEFKESAPIISIENPPAGSGLNRAEDLRKLVEEAQKKFIDKAVKKEGLSQAEAEEQAKKLIGVTWDVGHINMIRKFGFGEKELIGETEKVAPYIKHIHLSDNFGLEHTELPMGMGNVPIKKHLAVLQKQYGDKVKELKQVIETGGWYQHFKRSPLPETLSAFGSPIYAMKMAPAWNQAYSTMGGYFGGYGQMLPEGNFSMYGAGFSGLPIELGGQVGGRNRLSGAPME